MPASVRHTVLLALAIWTTFSLLPAPAGAADWLDELTAILQDHREFARMEGREAAYESYVAQLHVARAALDRGDVDGVYTAMNTFMDMLEHAPEAAGIPLWSARAIFDYCAEVTPPMYHDISRHGVKKTA